MTLSFGFFVNEELTTSTWTEMIAGTDTLSLSQTVYLLKGSKISLRIRTNAEPKFVIGVGSSFTIALIGRCAYK